LVLPPPLVMSETELDQIFDALHHGLTGADQEYGAGIHWLVASPL
jgi:hypothetical protein